jgi:hypothetical protein
MSAIAKQLINKNVKLTNNVFIITVPFIVLFLLIIRQKYAEFAYYPNDIIYRAIDKINEPKQCENRYIVFYICQAISCGQKALGHIHSA